MKMLESYHFLITHRVHDRGNANEESYVRQFFGKNFHILVNYCEFTFFSSFIFTISR
jgi:hypothetical protein